MPEEWKRDDRLVEPPCRHKVNPVGVGSVVPPGSLVWRKEGAGVTQSCPVESHNGRTLCKPLTPKLLNEHWGHPQRSRGLPFRSSSGKTHLLGPILSELPLGLQGCEAGVSYSVGGGE